MVIEHEFVTTCAPLETMKLASEFLASRGFVQTARDAAFALDQGEWSELQMTRGRKSPRSAKRITDLPQVVRLEFDRGRVTVACSITPGGRWAGKRAFWSSLPMERPDRLPVHRDLLMAIARGLELRLACNAPKMPEHSGWDAVEAHCETLRQQRVRRNVITGVAVVILFACLIAAVALVNKR